MKIKTTNPMKFSLVMLFASIFLIAAGAAMAQSEQAAPEQAAKESNSLQSIHCIPNFSVNKSFGSGASKFAFCITDRGNVLDLESPAGFTQIAGREGYAVCSSAGVHGYDVGTEQSGWDITSFNPTDPNFVGIGRSTKDGAFDLGQHFYWDATKKQLQIDMELKNTSGAAITDVKLVRYFDADLSGDSNDDRYDTDADSVWGRDDGTGAGHHGILLTALNPFPIATFPHTAVVEKYTDFSPTGAVQTATTCTPIAQTVPTAPGDHIGRITFNLGTIAAGASKEFWIIYNRF